MEFRRVLSQSHRFEERLDQRLVIITNDDDKALIKPFLEAMHGKNASPEVVNAALTAWNTVREQIQTVQKQNDTAMQAETEETLRAEYGSDYRRNINVITGWVDTAPKGVKEAFLNARLADDTLLANNPDIIRFLLSGAIAANPAATVVPGSSGASAAQTIDTEIAGIEKLMRENRSEYDRDPKNSQRYLDLLRAKERLAQG